MRQTIRLGGVALVMIAFSAKAVCAANWQPPANGKLEDKQLTSYIEILKEQMQSLKSAGKAMNGSQSTAAALAVYARTNEKIQAAMEKHGMSQPEFDWVGSQVGELWIPAMYQMQWEEHGKPDLENQVKSKQAEIATAKQTIETYQAAQKENKRILTKDQRDQAIQQATSDRDSATQDVKDKEDALKAVTDEVKLHQKEASDADALAKNPPAEVSADDRQGYVDGKKGEAQTARDAAKEAQDRQKESQKNLDDAKARLAAATNRMAHPEVAVTDDEKAAVQKENEQAITQAKATISDNEETVATLQDTLKAGPMVIGDPKKLDPDNLALVRKHVKDYMAAIGMDPNAKM